MESCECNEPKPVLKMVQGTSNKAVLVTTVNGLRTEYDMTSIVQAAETKTSAEINSDSRNFIYHGEDENYTLSGGELAGIMHLAEIGDVSASGVEAGSLLIYDAELAKWKVWNASQNTSSTLTQLVGVNGGNTPVILNAPGESTQYYFLGWTGGGKLAYFQPAVVASAPVDSQNKIYPMYFDPTTKQIVSVATAKSS